MTVLERTGAPADHEVWPSLRRVLRAEAGSGRVVLAADTTGRALVGPELGLSGLTAIGWNRGNLPEDVYVQEQARVGGFYVGVTAAPLLSLTSGYVQRSAHLFPKQGSRQPWQVHQNYLRDYRALKLGGVEDDALG